MSGKRFRTDRTCALGGEEGYALPKRQRYVPEVPPPCKESTGIGEEKTGLREIKIPLSPVSKTRNLQRTGG